MTPSRVRRGLNRFALEDRGLELATARRRRASTGVSVVDRSLANYAEKMNPNEHGGVVDVLRKHAGNVVSPETQEVVISKVCWVRDPTDDPYKRLEKR